MNLEKIVQEMIAGAKLGSEANVEGRLHYQWVCSGKEAKRGAEIAKILLAECKKIYPMYPVEKVELPAPNQEYIIQIAIG